MIGHTIKSRYRVYDELGAGGAATVYLARDSESGQMVIVKVVHSHLVDDQFIGRFEREIDLLQQLDNPHIVKLYDWSLQEFDETLNHNISYIVDEFIEGHTLAHIIDTQGAFGEKEALVLGRQLALALAAIHSRGIVHRDIKAQNIMITPAGQAKLIDFGIAKGQNHATLTAPAHFAGTLHYAPPEQILETSEVDHRADLYSLGVVFYEMLTGGLPVKAKEFGTIASKIISGDLDPITGVSDPCRDLVNYMLAHRVERRIGSAQAVVELIDEIVGTESVVTEATTAIMNTVAMQPKKEQAVQKNYILVGPEGQRVELTQASMVIGRSHPSDPNVPDIDLQALGMLEARTASRRHCRIFRDGGVYYVEDMGSMNGSRLNGQTMEANTPYEIHEGDVLQTGRVDLTFTSV